MKELSGSAMTGTALAALFAVTIGVPALAQSTNVASAEECSPQNWKGCEGKPWVDEGAMETPLGPKWWPNPLWGTDDQAGSTNWYTQPEVLKRAMGASTGEKVYKLGHPYSVDMPLFGTRQFTLRIPGAPSGGNDGLGANKVLWNDDYLSTEVSQVGTQFDGLGHIGVQVGEAGDQREMRWYNGRTMSEMANATGLNELGTEKLHPIVARGILLDIAAIWDGQMEAGDEITMEHVRAALENQGMADFEFQPGDALLFRTDWDRHWDDAETFNSGEPGIGIEVARWAAEEVQAGLTGADTWAVEVIPNPDPGCVFCVHTFLQARHGIVNQENMKLSELAEDDTYVFTYMYSPAPIVGATGSMGAPLAVK